jgi:hypothetical protein
MHLIGRGPNQHAEHPCRVLLSDFFCWRFYRAIREGWIPPGVVVRSGRRVFIDRTKFEKWAAQGGQKMTERASGRART